MTAAVCSALFRRNFQKGLGVPVYCAVRRPAPSCLCSLLPPRVCAPPAWSFEDSVIGSNFRG